MFRSFRLAIAALLLVGATNASAVVFTSTNSADFVLTKENFQDLTAGAFQTGNLVSFSGNLTIDPLGTTLATSHKLT